MSEYVTGQNYGWNGGECPVHPETEVSVWFRGQSCQLALKAGYLSWEHLDGGSDIVCFQVITPHIEPKVIWVNEHNYGGMDAYLSKQTAKDCATGHTLLSRIAVKYVEEQK
jgi:hypothetical protein